MLNLVFIVAVAVWFTLFQLNHLDSSPDTVDPPTGDEVVTDDGNIPPPADDATHTEITLQWVAPTMRANGDYLMLSEIGGYEIRYWNHLDGKPTIKAIDDPSITQVTLVDLPPGTYSFQLRVFDIQNVYSPMTDTIEINL